MSTRDARTSTSSYPETGVDSSPHPGQPWASPPFPKIQGRHLERLAVVYIRQSSPQQIRDHRESTARQYALADHAVRLGWPADRVLVIDEDQGQSGRGAASRSGFQRLLAEVALEHVGLVLGLEISRLARSCKDCYHLLEVCGLFGTLLADQDGVYDPNDPNDRIVLGLKGTMGELELHTMRGRLDQGRLNKARRGELIVAVPVGYIRCPAGTVEQEPDEAARGVVELVFAKFEEHGGIGAVCRYLWAHRIDLGIRPLAGPNRGILQWRRPCRQTIRFILTHPIYAGAYAYGRVQGDPRRKVPGRPGSGRHAVPMDRWTVLIKDRFPAYISWEQYLANQERLRQNQARAHTRGAPRQGHALLGGLVICGHCGWRRAVHYQRRRFPLYACHSEDGQGRRRGCPSLAATALDALVTQQVLRALEPAALELSLQAMGDLQEQRQRQLGHWEKRVEQARYDAHRTERQYQAVEPENRLVGRTPERRWEEALHALRDLEEQLARLRQETPPGLTAAEREEIRSLAASIPTLWDAATTTEADRKEIIRRLVERVVVTVRGVSEHVDVVIRWHGGFTSRHDVRRSLQRYEGLHDFDRLMARVSELRRSGCSSEQIATRLNQEGYHPARRGKTFNREMVRQLLCRQGLTGEKTRAGTLGAGEWWLGELARRLAVSAGRLRQWQANGWLHARRSPLQRLWIVWADRRELQRLRRLRDHRPSQPCLGYPAELTRPGPRPSAH